MPTWQPGVVPRFEPFRALRYAPSMPLDDVIAPPYDVLSADDVAGLRDRHPNNIVHIDVPQGPDETEPHAEGDRYEHAAALLWAWRESRVLVVDDVPSFTLYRMRFVDETGAARDTVGVIGALEVVDEGADGVLPHERTTPKAKTDRLDLTRATEANLSPVWGLSLSAGLSELLAAPGEPLGSTTVDGVDHVVELVDDPTRVAAIAAAVGAQPVLIADGHHRYAISRTYRDEQRAAGAAGGPAELTMTYVAELVEDQLSIDAIHRLYHGISAADLGRALSSCFESSPAGPVDATFPAQLVARGALCLVDERGIGTWLTPKADALSAVRALDGAYLEHALGALDVDVTYQHGVDEVLHAVTTGLASAAVLIRPTSIEEIRRTADERLLMPPKSTFFTPKLRTGLVVRSLQA